MRHLAAAQHGGLAAATCAKMIETGWFDHLQPAMSVLPDRDALAMLELAKKHDVGIITKKTMGAIARAKKEAHVRAAVEKHLGKSGKWGAAVIKTMLTLPGVTAVTPRTLNFDQFIDNLSAEGIKPTPAESAAVEVLRKFASAEVCSYCGKCLGTCPQGVAVSDVLRYATYYTAYDQPEQARRLYAGVPASRRPDRCVDCGACERSCPQTMPVRQKLQEAHALLA